MYNNNQKYFLSTFFYDYLRVGYGNYWIPSEGR